MVFWERVLTRWEKNRCSGNLESRGSEVLCGGERGRGWGDRCVSGCFGGSEGGLVSLPCFRGLFRAVFSLTLETSQHAAVKSSERRHTIAL